MLSSITSITLLSLLAVTIPSNAQPLDARHPSLVPIPSLPGHAADINSNTTLPVWGRRRSNHQRALTTKPKKDRKSQASIIPRSSTMTTTTSKAPAPTPTSPYALTRSHQGASFFDGWDFFTWPDPTHGQVNFLNKGQAYDKGLVSTTSSGSTILKVDDWSWLGAGQHRDSVRITSKEQFREGTMVVMDAAKMPHGPGVWPAFWSVGADWPYNGEIDIVEGVHNSVKNQYTLHTYEGCTLKQPMQASGTPLETNCDVAATGNAGCGIRDTSSRTFGSGWNSAGGGVYVMNWDSTGISMWVFLRGNIPADITAEKPNYQSWGPPRARFESGETCNISQYFGAQTLIFNITLCGDWAGSVYNQAGFSGTCSQAVQDPRNFVNAEFEINYVKIFNLK